MPSRELCDFVSAMSSELLSGFDAPSPSNRIGTFVLADRALRALTERTGHRTTSDRAPSNPCGRPGQGGGGRVRRLPHNARMHAAQVLHARKPRNPCTALMEALRAARAHG